MPPPPPPTLILLPGLGADHRLFAPQLAAFPNLIVPPWHTPHSGDTLESFALRMAERIPRDRPFILGGASLGGMIAAQLTHIVKPTALILIGTCLHPREIATAAKLAASAAPLLTDALTDRLRAIAPTAIRALGPMTREQRAVLLEMTDAMPASFLRWAASAIFKWNGAPPAPCPTFRIHGAVDRIIPPPASGLELLIPRAGHIPSFTHPREVNRVIAAAMNPPR